MLRALLAPLTAPPPSPAGPGEKDPRGWCAAIALAFLALLLVRLGQPERIYFDEIHYVKAARMLPWLLKPINPEHPMVGKELIAAGILLLGDQAWGWRIFPALFGTLGLFAFSRALWLASGRTFATLAGTLLLASSFSWYVMSRIAMLDMFMASFILLALWMLAGAVRAPSTGRARWRLALGGLFLGLALGSKWNAMAAAALPGLAFAWLRLKRHGRRFLLAREGAPVNGITLAEAALWLGAVPLLVYWATFLPTFFYAERPVVWWKIAEYQGYMLRLQESVKKHHPYQSLWWQWVLDLRAIWFFYSPVNGVWRGVLMLGNPLAMWAGLPAVGWCLWAGLKRLRRDALAAALLYLASVGMWISNGKPVQFYYHYLLPSAFLIACLALALDALWRRADRWRRLAPATVGLCLVLFAVFFPILSAGPLCCGRKSFEFWMWLPGWR